MRFFRNSVVGLFFLSTAVVLVLLAIQMVTSAISESMNNERPRGQARERVFAVSTVTATVADVRPELQAFGKVESRRTLEMRSAVSGRVIHLAEQFEDGGLVREGDALVAIDQADARDTLSRARADMLDAQAEKRDSLRAYDLAQQELDAAEVQAELQHRAYQRQVDLRARGVGTEATVESAELTMSSANQSVISRRQSLSQAQARVDQADTNLARVEIALAEAQRDLDDTTITAPFTGTLQSVSLVEGRLVSANEVLAELVDPDLLEVAFRVSTAQYTRLIDSDGRLLPNQVTIAVDPEGLGPQARGVLSRVSGAVEEGQSGRLIYARLNDAVGFQPGDFVVASVEEPMLYSVIRLPAAAMDARETVLILGTDSRLEEMPVRLVRRQGDEILVRADGLSGRQVVAGRTPLLGKGIRVRPLNGASDQAAEPAPEMLELSEERRANLVSFVENNNRMPSERKEQVLQQLAQQRVPAALVNRIESRIGG